MSFNVNGPTGSSPTETLRGLSGLFSQLGGLVGGSGTPTGGTFGKVGEGLSIASGLLGLIPGFGQIASLATGLMGGIARLFGGGR